MSGKWIFYREATLRPHVRGERGVVSDGDGADDGQSHERSRPGFGLVTVV
jgi:hypothetical protein